MGQLIDEATSTETIASGASGTPLEVKTGDHARSVAVFINDGSGNAPADYTLLTEVYDADADTWHQKDSVSTTGATGETFVSHDAIPDKMRFTPTNDSAGSADFQLRAVAHR